MYSSLSNKKKALAFYNQALPLQRDVGDRAGHATTLSNIGSVYWKLGDKKKALAFYNQALPLHRDVGDRAGQATTLSNIGIVYADLGDKKKALAFYNQALPLQRDVGDDWGLNVTLYNQAKALFFLERDQEGFAALREAVHVGCRRGKPDCPRDALDWFTESIRRRQMAEARAALDTLTNHVQRFDDLKSRYQPLVTGMHTRLQHLTEPFGSTILITRLVSGGPAARNKQLRTGDLIITYDGRPIRDVEDFPALVRSTANRPAVKIVVLRGVNRVPLQVQGGRLGVAIQRL